MHRITYKLVFTCTESAWNCASNNSHWQTGLCLCCVVLPCAVECHPLCKSVDIIQPCSYMYFMRFSNNLWFYHFGFVVRCDTVYCTRSQIIAMGTVARDTVLLLMETFEMKCCLLTLIEHQSSSENLWALYLWTHVLHWPIHFGGKKSANIVTP
jgi:hypothetical protein